VPLSSPSSAIDNPRSGAQGGLQRAGPGKPYLDVPMTDVARTTDRAPERLPILFIVDGDADEEGRAKTVSALRRRFGSDYRVLAADSAEAELTGLEDLARQGVDVALVGADIRLTVTDGVEFLERAHALHQGASRALLIPMAVAGHASPR
jgi:CheY-like chemotaxis protein